MSRATMQNTVGVEYLTTNIEGGEFSYVQAAGSREKLQAAFGRAFNHFKLDLRFFDEESNVAVLIETKQRFVDDDIAQLQEYVAEEKALYPHNKIIAILANTTNEELRVWKSYVDDEHELPGETAIDTMAYYTSLFETNRQNNREKVLRNTYALNELLHKKDIDEKLRSQFVGTTLLYVKSVVTKLGISEITDETVRQLREYWATFDAPQIRTGIETTLDDLLDDSDNKIKKIKLLRTNVVNDQKVKKLALDDWLDILMAIVTGIYAYIDEESSEGQDLLNLFFIAFNKYTGKADKNQAFTPDHITEFACRVTGVDRHSRIFDGTCGSGSFLVQGMVKALSDCTTMPGTQAEKEVQQEKIKREHIYGVENEEKVYGLATTNMLIHGDGNSNIEFASLFDSKKFFYEADPDIVLMNPPFNAKPIGIPDHYKTTWGSAKNGKEDPTKGMVFVQFVSDCVMEANAERRKNNQSTKTVKMAVILPVAAAIGANKILKEAKRRLLINNTLEAVFTLPNEIFYPGASASACMMLFTLGQPHYDPATGGPNKATFFGYYKDDAHVKKKNLGRIEQFDRNNASKWKAIEDKWLKLYRNKTVEAGMSAMQEVTHEDEWLVEAYMKTDYSKLTVDDFQATVNNYLAYLVKEGRVIEGEATSGVEGLRWN
ncbi:HsdM family class I SAM-dependent methyltransferase [Corynebacterium mastitidis]|uniref:HsdM family class I SAM-dependent methyltransferase n=1 Tax=Corynebacterium mastitidis TaxID=161890 RepID=UPI00254E88A1|nr:N-6 DNA methylase [Corynebacterium mastitidis]MDK8450311.1 N-6 DNA methylase [Corynebacterium mastitidis]